MVDLKAYSVCHKEFRDSTVEHLTDKEKKSVCGYIVNENYPKKEDDFSK